MVKQYAIFDSATNLYSLGVTHSIQQWRADIDDARLWNELGHIKSHIKLCNKQAKAYNRPLPYTNSVLVVEITVTRNQNGNTIKVNP